MADYEDDDLPRYRFKVYTAEDFSAVFGRLDPVNGGTADARGSLYYLNVYDSYAALEAAGQPLFSLSVGNGLTITNDASGQIQVVIARADIQAKITITDSAHPGQPVPQKRCPFQWMAEDGAGLRRVCMTGEFIFLLGMAPA